MALDRRVAGLGIVVLLVGTCQALELDLSIYWNRLVALTGSRPVDPTVVGASVVSVIVLSALFMFSDTFMGSVDMASAGVRYMYDRAATTGSAMLNQVGGKSPMDDFGLHLKLTHPEAEPVDLTEDQVARLEHVRRLKVGGLYNEGNTCFMNSVVQSFASLDGLQHHIDQIKDTNPTEDTGEAAMTLALDRVMAKLNEKLAYKHTYSTQDLIRSSAKMQRWAGYDQEDAQEFFQQLLMGLEEDTKRCLKDKDETQGETQGQSQGQSQESQESQESQDEKPRNEKKKIKQVTPFDGGLATRVGCMKCGETEGIRHDVVSSIDLSLQGKENNEEELTLEDMLRDYCSMEVIAGVECYRCSLRQCVQDIEQRVAGARDERLKALFSARLLEVHDALDEPVIDETKYKKLKPEKVKTLGDKTKQHMFSWPLAEVLMIHINRSVFDMTTGYTRKNYAPVDFPVYLDFAPFVVDATDEARVKDPKQEMPSVGESGAAGQSGAESGSSDKSRSPPRIWYGLKAAVVHFGSHNFGHYVCYRKCSEGLWWRISDHAVELATEAQMLRSQGVFMLFYEKLVAGDKPGSGESSSAADHESDITEMSKL